MAPPHGLTLSSFLSKIIHSILGFWARISAAQEPDGPPPTTATLYFAPSAKLNDIYELSMRIYWYYFHLPNALAFSRMHNNAATNRNLTNIFTEINKLTITNKL